MFLKKLVLPASVALLLAAMGCSSSSHRSAYDRDRATYDRDSASASDGQFSMEDQHYNTDVMGNALHRTSDEYRPLDVRAHNTDVMSNAMNGPHERSQIEEFYPEDHNTSVMDNALKSDHVTRTAKRPASYTPTNPMK